MFQAGRIAEARELAAEAGRQDPAVLVHLSVRAGAACQF